jgi:hypothetical protein
MPSVQERITKLGKMFSGLNIGNDGSGKQFIYLEVIFPKGWGVVGSIKEKYGVNIVKNDTGTGYYFWAPIETGFDAVFDAADYNIRANEEAQEKKDFLSEKIRELQKLVLEEDMSVLKTLEFKVKKKKTIPSKKKAVENKEPEAQEERKNNEINERTDYDLA